MLQKNKTIIKSTAPTDSKFPRFRKLNGSDEKLIKQSMVLETHGSQFNFSSLMLYNDPPCKISFLNDNIVLRANYFL